MTLATEITSATLAPAKSDDQAIVARDLEIAFNLPPMTARLLLLLLSRKALSGEEARHEISSVCDAKAAIFRLRRYLAKHNIKINSQRFTGYWLSPADKQRVLEITSGGIGGDPSA